MQTIVLAPKRTHVNNSYVIANYPNRKHYWVISHLLRSSDYTSESEHGKGYWGNIGFLSLSPLSSAGCALTCQLCAHDACLYFLACSEVVFVWSVVSTKGNTINSGYLVMREVPSACNKANTNEQDGMCLTKWRNKTFQGRQASLGLPQGHMDCENLLLPVKGQFFSLGDLLIILVTQRLSMSHSSCFGGN